MTERIQMGLVAHKDGKIAVDEVQPYWNRAKAFDPGYSEPKASIKTPPLQPGQRYHKVIYIGILPGSVNNGQHHAFVDYVDENGTRVRDPHKRFKWGWKGMSLEEFFATGAIIVDKPDAEFGGNVALSAGQQAIVCAGPSLTNDPFGDGMAAEWVEGVHTAFPDLEKGNTRFHTSTLIVYTKAVWPGQATPVYTINAVATPPEGGEVAGDGQYEEGQVAQLEAAPNQGYRFVGWFEDGALISQIPAMSFTVLVNRNLEARFERRAEQPEIPTLSAQARTEVSFNKLDLQRAIDNTESDVVTIAFEA
jgi:hypothetical protein